MKQSAFVLLFFLLAVSCSFDVNSFTSVPGETIVAIAMNETNRGANAVGSELSVYPYRLSNYITNNEAWCSEFVSWVYRVAGAPFTTGYEDGWLLKSTTKIRSWFGTYRRFIDRSSPDWSTFIPSPGDYIRYDNASGGHSGIVRFISNGVDLYTVEGNTTTSHIVKCFVRTNWRTWTNIDGIGDRVF